MDFLVIQQLRVQLPMRGHGFNPLDLGQDPTCLRGVSLCPPTREAHAQLE